jgi:hypothetical protein
MEVLAAPMTTNVRHNQMRDVLPVLTALLTGCAGHDWANPSDRKACSTLVESSTSYQRARAIDATRVIWFVEERGPSPHIYLGFDMGTHTCRSATLRICEGAVQRQELQEDGELVWVADR